MPRAQKSEAVAGELLHLPNAAAQLGISVPTLKQWIYKKKIRSVRTTGGHHRIPQSELDRLLHRSGGKTTAEHRAQQKRISGRNQLVGRIESIRISGLLAEVVLSIGDQRITSIITARAVREMQLRPGQTAAALIKSTEVMILRV
jgi:molybdopterin-binding protein